MRALPPGAMLAVPLPEAEVRAAAARRSCRWPRSTAPGQCVVSGPPRTRSRRSRRALAERGVAGRPLHTSHAFHSRDDGAGRSAPFAAAGARGLDAAAAGDPLLSNVTGTWITAEEATDPAYWARHLRGTVRFADGLAELLRASPSGVLLEVGPRPTPCTALARASGRRRRPPVAALASPRGRDRRAAALAATALGRLWQAGVEVDWPRFHAGERRRRVPLPTYPFERRRYWVDPSRRPGRPPLRRPARPARLPAAPTSPTGSTSRDGSGSVRCRSPPAGRSPGGGCCSSIRLGIGGRIGAPAARGADKRSPAAGGTRRERRSWPPGSRAGSATWGPHPPRGTADPAGMGALGRAPHRASAAS